MRSSCSATLNMTSGPRSGVRLPAADGLECLTMMIDVGFAPAGRPGDDQHVETGGVSQQVAAAEEVEGGVGQLPLLALIDGFGGTAFVLVLGRADLDEDDGAAVEGDEVDLAVRGVDVPGDDAEAGAAQIAA